MNTRKLGKDGFEIGEIGLGCWQIGGNWGENLDATAATQILATAAQSGTSFFDTANVYGDGQSERFIGDYLTSNQQAIRVATKFGRGDDVFPDGYTRLALRESVLASLERLKVSQLDLIQLHCVPTQVLRDGEIFNWLRELKQEGLIAHFGASVESVEEGLICLEQEGLCSLQVIFNIFRQKLIKELFPQAKEAGVGIIVRLPLASGLLSGKFSASTTFIESDHRNFNRNGDFFNVGETFAGLPFEKGVALAQRIKTMLPTNATMAQLALRWILDHDAVSVVIPGASSPQQAKDNAAASALPPLSQPLHDALSELYANEIHAHIRGIY
ncbi:aldo/keto reductase [Coraliomargarita sp. W4R72]